MRKEASSASSRGSLLTLGEADSRMWGTDGHFSEEEMGWKYIQKLAQWTVFLLITVFLRVDGQGKGGPSCTPLSHSFIYFEGTE